MGEERRYRRHVKAEDKVAAVMRVLKGDDINVVANEFDTSPDRIGRWQSRFIEAGSAALAKKKGGIDKKTVWQWGTLIILLIGTVLFLVRFLNRDQP
jgi:transposase-like protein